MITKIGLVSGEILTFLEENAGSLSFGDLESRLRESRDLILMSLGWLIREGCIHSEYQEGLLVVSQGIKNNDLGLKEFLMEV